MASVFALEEARKVARALQAWQWISAHIESDPPPADGFRHPQVDLEGIAAEAVVRAAHELARHTSLAEHELVEALVDVGVTVEDAVSVVACLAAWLAGDDD